MSTTTARLALLCALVGLGAAGIAAYVHYRMFADPTYTSFCDVSTTVSCTQVYASRFGTFRGISVSVFGGIWFGFAALMSIAGMTARPSVRESIPGYLFAASTLALAAVLYLGYASFVILKLVCVLCLITYAAVIGLFLISGAATSIPMLSLPRRAAQDLKTLVTSPMAIALAVLWLGGAATTLAFFPREAAPATAALGGVGAVAPEVTQDQRSELERFMASAPRVPLMVPNEGAKVLIVKFADYQCPACGQAYLRLQADHREVRGIAPRPGQGGPQGLPAQPELQRRRADHAAPVGVRRGRGRTPGARAQSRRSARGLPLHQPEGRDAGKPAQGSRRRRPGDRLRRQVRRHARAGEGRHRAWGSS